MKYKKLRDCHGGFIIEYRWAFDTDMTAYGIWVGITGMTGNVKREVRDDWKLMFSPALQRKDGYKGKSWDGDNEDA